MKKKLFVLGLMVYGSNAQIIDNNAQIVDDRTRVDVVNTAAQVNPYITPAVSITAGRPAIVTTPAGATPVGTVQVIPVLTVAQQQELEMQKIRFEIAEFWAIHAHQAGTISARDWLDFANRLVAEHPHMLELRCDRPSGTGQPWLRFRNPFFLNGTALSQDCILYVKPSVRAAPLIPYP